MTVNHRVLDLAIQIQQIPSPTFYEGERAAYIKGLFEAENLANIETDQTGNVLAKLSGVGSSPPVVVTAHSDTVFPLETDLTITREELKVSGPGIGDNSLGTAGLFGLLWLIQERDIELAGDLWLIANTCEEGLGDLKGMRAIVDRFSDEPIAYIVVEGMALGQIYHRGLGVQRYKIETRGDGGHSWVDYGTPSAIHELASFVTKISAIELPSDPRTSMNVGVITGGTSVNTIAAEAELQLDLRSTDPKTLSKLAETIEKLAANSSRSNIEFKTSVIGLRPAGSIPKTNPLVKLAALTLKDLGIKPKLSIGSTDANIPLSKGFPCVCIGLTYGSGAHTVNEYIFTESIGVGLNQLANLVEQSFDVLN